jgi:hypothetical protein
VPDGVFLNLTFYILLQQPHVGEPALDCKASTGDAPERHGTLVSSADVCNGADAGSDGDDDAWFIR